MAIEVTRPEAMAAEPPPDAAQPVSPAVETPLPNPIVTRQVVFAIPFELVQSERPDDEPVEVQLHVSADRGVTWKLYGRVAPGDGRFPFRAPADGEYWFVVRTVSRSGALRPQSIVGPELRVIIDLLPPVVKLNARQGPSGEITAEWTVTDPSLDAESFTIQFRLGATQPWQRVAVGKRGESVGQGVLRGETTWWPNAATGVLQIRAEATDLAGNPSITHALVTLAAPAGAQLPVAGRATATPPASPNAPIQNAAAPVLSAARTTPSAY